MSSFDFVGGELVASDTAEKMYDLMDSVDSFEQDMEALGYLKWDSESWFEIYRRKSSQPAPFGDYEWVVTLDLDDRTGGEDIFVRDLPGFIEFMAYLKPLNDHLFRMMERSEREVARINRGAL